MHEYMRWCSILNKEVREGITEKEPFKQGPKGQHGNKPYEYLDKEHSKQKEQPGGPSRKPICPNQNDSEMRLGGR